MHNGLLTEKINKKIYNTRKTNTVSDASSVDRHTLGLQTRKHGTGLKTKKEVKQITTNKTA